jgi:hypothetical protein
MSALLRWTRPAVSTSTDTIDVALSAIGLAIECADDVRRLTAWLERP